MKKDIVIFNGTLKKNPINPRYFTDNTGKAIYLTGSHTWAVMQDMWIEETGRKEFDYDEFMDFMKAHNHNFLRFWQFALQSAGAPWTNELVYFDPLPYARTGPGNALDGKLKFDLDRWNEEYFVRLRERVVKASSRGIYVAVMFFEGWCNMWANDKINPWPYHPYNTNNNINGINGDLDGDGKGEIYSLEISEVVEYEKAFVRKVIDTVNDLDNVLFEIINEQPYYSKTVLWSYSMVDFVHEYEKSKPKQHPVGMTAEGWGQDNSILFNSSADWISPGAGPCWEYRHNPPAADGRKVIISDTDHLWGHGGNHKWVWKSFIRGLNPILMDPWEPIAGRSNDGVPGTKDMNRRDYPGWDPIRKNMGYARKYAERIDLNKMVPHSELATSTYCLANPGNEYLVYLPEGGSVGLFLGTEKKCFNVEWFDPTEGKVYNDNPAEVRKYPGNEFTAPFNGDAVLYLQVTGK